MKQSGIEEMELIRQQNEKKISVSEQLSKKIDHEYAEICQRLGDAILRKEALELEIGAIRARVQKLRDQKASFAQVVTGE
jgi:hypothetical protein